MHAPPGCRWTPGYWDLTANGWRWIPGFWSIIPSPPPYSPPPPLYASNVACLNDPGFGLFATYGMWWPYYYPFYRYRPLPERPHPLSPPHHSNPIPSFVMPTLASSLHAPPAPHEATLPPSDLPRLDLASVFASVPKPLEESLQPAKEFASLREHDGRLASFLLHPHLASALHDHPSFHGEYMAHPFGGEHECGRALASSAHASGGHGGGHGR
jgi:hypothetical protein